MSVVDIDETSYHIWTLRSQGVKFAYSKTYRTFFWADHQFYNANKAEILEWASLHNCIIHTGISFGWITCPDEHTAFLFRLRWA